MTDVTVKYEDNQGRQLECRYSYSYVPATFHDPDESESGEPVYFLDGEEVEFDNLPDDEEDLKGAAIEMYNAGNRNLRFSYVESEPSSRL